MDFATRQYNHNFRMDPIVRSRMDDDFYKRLMGNLIDQKHPSTVVAFALTNRTADVRLADLFSVEEVREQLDHVQTLRFQPNELIWLQGNTFYGQTALFPSSYINTLRLSRLPDYEVTANRETGQFIFRTQGRWGDSSGWEIPVLSVLNELRNRAVMRSMSRSQLDILYARAKTKLFAKLERLARVEGLTVSDFGTRRRHSFMWQEHCVLTAAEVLGDKFVGTSNSYLAMKHGIESKGTNAHELPMVYAALAGSDDDAVRASQYQVLKDWQSIYGDNLRIFLPDTFGTTQFLRDAPDWVSWWTGGRPDSKEPFAAGEELVNFWVRHGQDPHKKLIVFADGMDVKIPGFKPNGTDIVDVHQHFQKLARPTFGWGTNFTNDFIGCPAGDPMLLKPISIVCKVDSADGRPAVKLSDNYTKATSSDAAAIERYRAIFGTDGIANAPALV